MASTTKETTDLRLGFPGGAGPDELEHVSSDNWFDVFEDDEPALHHEVEKADGSDSTSTLVRRR